MDAEVSETVMQANCTIPTTNVTETMTASDLPGIDKAIVTVPVVSDGAAAPRTVLPPTAADLDAIATMIKPSGENSATRRNY